MAAAEAIRPRMGTGGKVRLLSLALAVAFGLLLAVLFARTASIVVTYPPTFDGAMNLQVASSIAKGDGYRRNYATREAFPHEIQTGAPYVVPAAAVFKIWGVGIWQSEIVNILYLAALLIAIYLLVVPLGGPALALFAACTAIVIPGIHEFGFYGYGEVPGLFFALGAIAAYFPETAGGARPRGLVAGILLALAFYTKTVMLIGIGSLWLYALLQWWYSPGRRERSGQLLAMAAGGAASVTLMEAWRLSAVGGFHAWTNWWYFETRSILAQAGAGHGFGNFTHSLTEKFAVHISALSHDYRMSLLLTMIWLGLLLIAAFIALLQPSSKQGKWRTLTVLTIAVVYMLWWLLITPTAKAWHRRILDGMLAADVGLIMFVAAWMRSRNWSALGRSGRACGLIIAAAGLALPAMWLVKGSHSLLAAQGNDKACAWHVVEADLCAPSGSDPSVSALRRVSKEVHGLPLNAYIFGVGFYSAPRVGLLSGRHLLDINDVPVLRLQPGRPTYIVQGPDTPPSQLQRLRLLYGLADRPDSGFSIIPGGSLTPAPIARGSAPVLRHIWAADDYPYLRGFNESEGANGRWLSSDNVVLLTPQAGDRFELAGYALPLSGYEYPSAPRVVVSFNGCEAPAQTVVPAHNNDLVFPIPSSCRIVQGRPVNVRIRVDNLANVELTLDQRPLTILAKSLGFTDRLDQSK